MQVLIGNTVHHVDAVPERLVPSCFHSDPMPNYTLSDGQSNLLYIRQTWQNNATEARENDPPQFTYIRFDRESTWYVFPKYYTPTSGSTIWR